MGFFPLLLSKLYIMKDFLIGIDHPAIAADDVEALTKWYCDALGYKVFFRTPKPVYIIEAPDGTYIEILPKNDTPRPERTNATPGLSHLAIRVNDMDVAMEALDTFNVVWGGPEFVPAGGGRIRNFTDPEGNALQLIQR